MILEAGSGSGLGTGSKSRYGWRYSFRAGKGSNLEASLGSVIKGYAFWLVIINNHFNGQKGGFGWQTSI